MKCPKCGGEMLLKRRDVLSGRRQPARTVVKGWQCQGCRLWRGSTEYWKHVKRNMLKERQERERREAAMKADNAGEVPIEDSS